MARRELLRASELARGAMDAATIASSFERLNPGKTEEYIALAETALNAALAELAKARMDRRSFLPIAAEIVSAPAAGLDPIMSMALAAVTPAGVAA